MVLAVKIYVIFIIATYCYWNELLEIFMITSMNDVRVLL